MRCRCGEVERMGTTPAFIRPPSTETSRRLGLHVVFILLAALEARCCSPHFPQFLRLTIDSEKLKDWVLPQEEAERLCVVWRVREAESDPATTPEKTRRTKLRNIARSPQRNLNLENLVHPASLGWRHLGYASICGTPDFGIRRLVGACAAAEVGRS